MNLYPVIMAGGSGTRFWPLSRKARPKQFLPLAGGKPLIAQCYERVLPLAPAKNAFVVCGKVHAPAVKRLLKKLPPRNVLVEPIARNTAPAIALAAAVVAKKDPHGVLLVLPSDHHVANPQAFCAALRVAAEAAAEGRLVTLGVKPTRPETGFGYVQQGPRIGGDALPLYEVQRFVEKPDLATAERYLACGEYLWNAGIFVLRADRILEETKKHLPQAVAPLCAIEKAVGTKGFAGVLARQFPKLPSISVDYGVMEKASGIAVVPADVGWSDVGAFPSLPEVRVGDEAGNVCEGQSILVDVKQSVILGGKRLLAVIGVSDLVVVDAGDAVLVCPKSRAQDVRKIVEELTRRKLGRLL